MTFFEVETGNPAVPNNIVDANELNDRFSAIVDSLQFNAYLGQAWMPMEISGINFDYNTANSITSDSNLTAVVQVGDKITFEQATDGEYFAFVTKIDWDTTVAGKTYIELFVYQQNDIEDEDITGGTVGLSRAKNPWGFPLDEPGWSVVFTSGSGISTTSSSFVQMGSVQLALPAGAYNINVRSVGGVRNAGGAQNNLVGRLALSEATTSGAIAETVRWWRTRTATASAELRNLMPWSIDNFYFAKTTATTIYLIGLADSGTETFASIGSSVGSELKMKATIAYL